MKLILLYRLTTSIYDGKEKYLVSKIKLPANLISAFLKSKRNLCVFFFWIILLAFPGFVNAQKVDESQVRSYVSGKSRPFICKNNLLQNKEYFNISGGIGNVSLDKNEWQCTVNSKAVEGYQNSTDIEVIIRPSKKTIIQAAMGVESPLAEIGATATGSVWTNARNKPMGWDNYSKYHKIKLSANEDKEVTFNYKR